jgi:glycosyltransferase involved in cell wall biosynthesis
MAEITVVINNRNRLTTTKNMVDKLLHLNPEEDIIIIDNDSSYPPLLKWYNEVINKVEIVPCKNEGHLALWSTGLYKSLGKFFVYTDSDIQLNENFPKDWKERMFQTWLKYEKKVALAIRTDDLPDHYRYKNQVIRNEGRWWLNELEPNIFQADTDTTFFMMENFGDNQYDSVRISQPDMICRHAPWYHDLTSLDDEETYYLKNLGSRVTTQYSKQHLDPEKYTDI